MNTLKAYYIETFAQKYMDIGMYIQRAQSALLTYILWPIFLDIQDRVSYSSLLISNALSNIKRPKS